MKTAEEIALEVAKEMDSGFLWSGECGILECEAIEFATRFLDAVDAERGKDAAAEVVWMADIPHSMLEIQMIGNITPPVGTKLFLSPTIPPNMALVPIPSTSKMDHAGVDAVGLDEFRATDAEKCFNAMIQAAGVTK